MTRWRMSRRACSRAHATSESKEFPPPLPLQVALIEVDFSRSRALSASCARTAAENAATSLLNSTPSTQSSASTCR
jgi:hypothetical protein